MTQSTMGALQLSKLKFFAGARMSAPSLEVTPSQVVVFVGPNNSGKSLALKEVEQWCWGTDAVRKVVSDIEFSFPQQPNEGVQLLDSYKTQPPANHTAIHDHTWVAFHSFRQNEGAQHCQISLPDLRNAITSRNVQQLRSYLLRLYTVRLDGRTRFALSDPKPSGDLLQPAQNHLWALFQKDAERERVRKLTEEAFGLHFVIDPTFIGQLRIRMSERAPLAKTEEQALDHAAREFHSNAKLIGDLSDGVQAFTGLVSAVMSLPHKVILIDEPEAFLHPPLARRLGSDLASLAKEREASLLAATHSADFLYGCIEAVPNVTIIRLTYEQSIATARSLPAQELRTLMLDPLLRSTGALRGLFHRSVVVTEADSDRAFYDEINHRLQEAKRGVDDALFINAQNWQTVSRILAPLRRIGILAAAIIDLDAICEQSGWDALYDAMNLTAAERQSLETQRANCAKYLTALPKLPDNRKPFKVHGVDALAGAEHDALRGLVADLSQFGVFVVSVGELERWLATLGVHGDKKEWLMNVFTSLGDDPASTTYVKPGSDDVWQFIDGIATWTSDPARKGIP